MTIHETNQHIKNENALAKRLAQVWGMKQYAMPKFHPMSRFFENKNFCCYAILSKREHEFNPKSTVLMDHAKFLVGVRLTESPVGTKFVIALEYTNGIFIYEPQKNETSIKLCWGGRTKQTRNVDDIEPVVHIPLELFSSLDAFSFQAQTHATSAWDLR